MRPFSFVKGIYDRRALLYRAESFEKEEKGMKKYVKKVIALGLAGAMLLTGCGSSKSDVAGTTDAAETEEWEAAGTEESVVAECEDVARSGEAKS